MKTYTHLACYAAALLLPIAALAAQPTLTDHQIDDAANDSYNFKAVLNGEVAAKTSNGVVTLTGTVPVKSDKELAENTVESLPGVTSVDNEIAVDPAVTEYSDNWIALKITGLLLVKANVSTANTHVAVKDGVVTLTGTVESDAQKDLTEAYVKTVDHVKSVENDLTVQAPEEKPVAASDNEVDDISITGQLKYELLADSNTSAVHTKVTTDHGVVIITGEAASDAEKEIVTRLAESIRGVKSVQNLMTIKAVATS